MNKTIITGDWIRAMVRTGILENVDKYMYLKVLNRESSKVLLNNVGTYKPIISSWLINKEVLVNKLDDGCICMLYRKISDALIEKFNPVVC